MNHFWSAVEYVLSEAAEFPSFRCVCSLLDMCPDTIIAALRKELDVFDLACKLRDEHRVEMYEVMMGQGEDGLYTWSK